MFGNPHARQLRRLGQYVGEGFFPGQLFDLGSYPGAVYADHHTTRVYGTVYDLGPHQPTLLKQLDDYEGIGDPQLQPDEYARVVVPVYCNDQAIDCWVYVFIRPTAGLRIIESGDYSRNE